MLSSGGRRPAAVLVVNQCFNDFVDLCFDLTTCRGRSALRESRALFEHHLNLLDVESSPTMARRYQLHGSVAAQTEARSAYGLDRLKGSELKAARHVLKKLARDSQEDYLAAVAEYGGSFRSNWAGQSVYDRAVAQGLTAEYDYYRLASAVLHGSAGGIKGTVSASYDSPVHRTGPALLLCPLAYLQGFRLFRETMIRLEGWAGEGSTRGILQALDNALACWPAYRRVVLQLDGELWPRVAPVSVGALMAIDRRNRVHWFLWDLEEERVLAAIPPEPAELPPGVADELLKIVDLLPPPHQRHKWITVHVLNVQLRAKAGAAWQPGTDILVSRDEAQYFDVPRILDLRRGDTPR